MRRVLIMFSVVAAGLLGVAGCSAPTEGAPEPASGDATTQAPGDASGGSESQQPSASQSSAAESSGSDGSDGDLAPGTYDATVTLTVDGDAVEVPDSQCAVLPTTVAIAPKGGSTNGLSLLIGENDSVTLAMTTDELTLLGGTENGGTLTLARSGRTFDVTGTALTSTGDQVEVDLEVVCG